MTKTIAASGSPARRALPVLLAFLAATLCCKSEKPQAAGGADPAAGGAPQPTETAAPERRPTILAKAEANVPPFSHLAGPRDAALDEKGRIWVADFGNNAVQIFDRSGAYLGGWGNRGNGNSQFKDPCALAVSGDDVYVADTWNGRVSRFSSSGEWKGKAPGEFYGPRGIAVGPDGRVWIADTGNQRVVLCEKDLSNPRMFGKQGSGAEEFSSPVGIAPGPNGTVYVADTDNRRIQILDADGHFKTRWKFPGWGPNSEAYLDVDSDGAVYATDPAARAVIQLDRKGAEVRRWLQDDAGRKFDRPTGIAIDSKNRVLYVVNTDSSTIVRLKLSGKP
jgi:tripartite motif-containing protein 71